MKHPEPLMINIVDGTRLLADDPVVKRAPANYVAFELGDRAVFQRRQELEQDSRARELKDRRDARDAAINVGTRILPSDDATAEAAKIAVRESDGDLVLMHDDRGSVIGARLK